MSVFHRIVRWAQRKSPWILHFNTGACNACDIEIIAALTPRFDLERFGVQLKGTPRHCDIMACSGPVTKQVKDRLIRIYEQVPEPKFVVAVGTCATSGGVFSGLYNVMGGIDQAIKVDAYIPGCPASPQAIIDGFAKLIKSLEMPPKPQGTAAGVAAGMPPGVAAEMPPKPQGTAAGVAAGMP